MKSKGLLVLIIFSFLGAMVLGAGCAKKVAKEEAPPVAEAAPPVEAAPPAEAAPPPEVPAAVEKGLSTIYFDFDKSDIRPDAKVTLDENSEWLKNNSGVSIEVEGHCDERGTDEYNLALGERRAGTTKSYLASQGISDARVTIKTYGEERPADSGHNEEAWAKNRRAEFIIASQ